MQHLVILYLNNCTGKWLKHIKSVFESQTVQWHKSDFKAGWFSFKSQFCHLLVLGPPASYLTTLNSILQKGNKTSLLGYTEN